MDRTLRTTDKVPGLVYAAGITLFVLHIADLLTTIYLVKIGGTGIELNPLMRWVMEAGGLLYFALVKIFVASFSAWWPPYAWTRAKNRLRIVLALALAVLVIEYLVVVGGNLTGVILTHAAVLLAPIF